MEKANRRSYKEYRSGIQEGDMIFECGFELVGEIRNVEWENNRVLIVWESGRVEYYTLPDALAAKTAFDAYIDMYSIPVLGMDVEDMVEIANG